MKDDFCLVHSSKEFKAGAHVRYKTDHSYVGVIAKVHSTLDTSSVTWVNGFNAIYENYELELI